MNKVMFAGGGILLWGTLTKCDIAKLHIIKPDKPHRQDTQNWFHRRTFKLLEWLSQSHEKLNN